MSKINNELSKDFVNYNENELSDFIKNTINEESQSNDFSQDTFMEYIEYVFHERYQNFLTETKKDFENNSTSTDRNAAEEKLINFFDNETKIIINILKEGEITNKDKLRFLFHYTNEKTEKFESNPFDNVSMRLKTSITQNIDKLMKLEKSELDSFIGTISMYSNKLGIESEKLSFVDPGFVGRLKNKKVFSKKTNESFEPK